jgi:hypothetical protein
MLTAQDIDEECQSLLKIRNGEGYMIDAGGSGYALRHGDRDLPELYCHGLEAPPPKQSFAD